MSTRSITTFIDNFTGQEIVAVYRHADGYPSGHGEDLAAFLKTVRIVNGFSRQPEGETRAQANGMAHLAALAVAKFFSFSPSIYLNAAGSFDMGEEYFYTVRFDGKGLVLEMREEWEHRTDPRKAMPAYAGPPEGFSAWREAAERRQEEG